MDLFGGEHSSLWVFGRGLGECGMSWLEMVDWRLGRGRQNLGIICGVVERGCVMLFGVSIGCWPVGVLQ